MRSSKRYTKSENKILRDALKENEVDEMIEITFLQKVVKRDM